MGAAMIAATGVGWFDSVQDTAKAFVSYGKEYLPNPENVQKYQMLHTLYKKIYGQTAEISHGLMAYRRDQLN